MRIELTLDDETYARAEVVASARGMSVEDLIRAHLEGLGSRRSPEEVVRDLEQLWKESRGDSHGQTWTREEIHGRSSLR